MQLKWKRLLSKASIPFIQFSNRKIYTKPQLAVFNLLVLDTVNQIQESLQIMLNGKPQEWMKKVHVYTHYRPIYIQMHTVYVYISN